MTRPLVDRFFARVAPRGPNECWLWNGMLSTGGYGQIYVVRHRVDAAHRVSWEIHNGPIPDGLWVLHRCDNPPCVNPAHLWLGTATDNARDMAAKGRATMQRHPEVVRRGSASNFAKLTEADVPLIRALVASGVSKAEVARRYGVDSGAIGLLIHRKTWRHVA